MLGFESLHGNTAHVEALNEYKLFHYSVSEVSDALLGAGPLLLNLGKYTESRKAGGKWSLQKCCVNSDYISKREWDFLFENVKL